MMCLFPLTTRQCPGMEECYPQGARSQLSLAQFYLGGGWGRDWRAQCERGKHTLGTQVSHTPLHVAHNRKCLEMTQAPWPPLGANTGCGQSLSSNNGLLWPRPSLLSCSLGKHRPHAY